MLIHTETREGFEINFYALPENTPLRDTFDDSVDDLEELQREIECGAMVYFCAKVTASKEGIELAEDYLCCCCYSNARDFIREDDYYGAMVRNVIDTARQLIADLAQN